MPWKKFSVAKMFNEDYYRMLLHRYSWLIILPIVIYSVMIFLRYILMLPIILGYVLLAGYAVTIVPIVALLLFHVYTKKSEANHLLSLPLTRLQIFGSQYMAGLTLIVVPLLWMSIILNLSSLYSNEIVWFMQFLIGIIALAIFYYSIAVLGCVLGGNIATQILDMGVICFGPILLLLFVNSCVDQLVFGSIPLVLESAWFYAIFPLSSGLRFMFEGPWPMWGFHLVLFIITMGLNVMLFNKRPMEMSGQAQAFFGSQKYLIRPLFYFALVYMIFVPLSSTMLLDGYYDTLYYLKVIVLLLCVSLLVVFVVNVWFSESLAHLFSQNNISQMLILCGLCCSLFFIPLFHRENMRLNILDEDGLSFTITNHNQIYLNFGYNCRDEIGEMLTYIDEHREKFSRHDSDYALYFSSDNYDSQLYRLDKDRLDDHFLDILEKAMIKSRQDFSMLNEIDRTMCLKYNGTLYDLNAFDKVVQTTWQNHLTRDTLDQAWLFQDTIELDNLYLTKDQFIEYYLLSLTDLDFETWFDQVISQLPVLMASDQLTAIEEVTNYLGTKYDDEHIVWNEAEKALADQIYLWGAENICAWDFESITSDYVHAKMEIQGKVINDVRTTSGDELFNGSDTNLRFDCEFKKENGQWRMYINRLEEVIY